MCSRYQSTLASELSTLERAEPYSPLDALPFYIVDIKNSPEIFTQTVNYVKATEKFVPRMVFMCNTDKLLTTREEGFWPKYRLYRDDIEDGLMTQVFMTVKVEELAGFPKDFPSTWMCVTRGDDSKVCIGLVDIRDKEVSDDKIMEFLSACVVVVRGKIKENVELIVYVNRKLSFNQDCVMMNLKQGLSGDTFSSFTTSDIETRLICEGGLAFSLPAVGCSLCQVVYTENYSQEEHEQEFRHKRRLLYKTYSRDRSSLLQTPHEHGLEMVVAAGGDTDISSFEDGVVEVICKPGETKIFKLVLRNALSKLGLEEEEEVGLVVEELGMLKEEASVELSDEHQLCHNIDTKIRLKPGKKYKVTIKFTAGDIGQVKVPIMAAFYHETKSVRKGEGHILSRMAMEFLFKTQSEEIVSLQPELQFIPQPISKPWTVRDTVRAKPLPKMDNLDALEVTRPVGNHGLSEVRKRVVANKLEKCGTNKDERAEYIKCKELMRKGLTAENYTEFWGFLLHCERWQEERDLWYFKRTGERMTIDRDSGLLVLAIKGLEEGRPSVIRGDRIYVRENNIGTVEYEGMVHFVAGDHVKLSFSEKIIPEVKKGILWDVRFSFSPFTYENMHRAVELASKISRTLFPSASHLPRGIDACSLMPSINDTNVAKNPEQLAAVQAIVNNTSGSVPFIVFGPPGTGKTVTLVEAIRQVYELNPDAHILACAPSNSAADLLAIRLAKYVPRDDLMRMIAHSRAYKDVPDSIAQFSNLTPGGYRFPTKDELSKYRILITTLVTAGKLVSATFPDNHFQYVFVDEAGQATEPETAIALGGILNSDSGHLVMAGDPFQLGPIVRSGVARKHGLSCSLLERLMTSSPYVDPETGEFDRRCVQKLVRNFRSHPTLLEIPGRLFYNSELQSHSDSVVNTCLNFPGLTEAARGTTPIIVHGITGQDMREANSPSFYNPEEIMRVVSYVEELIADGVDEDDIGVITPYRKQVEKITWRLKDRNITDMMVGTTEEFQGQERKVIILSTVRSSLDLTPVDFKHRLGFLNDPKRFNVSITRSRALLIVVGNPHILYLDKDWRELLDYARKLDCYKGCPFPEEGEKLGKMEELYGEMLNDDMMEYARVEEMGMRQRN